MLVGYTDEEGGMVYPATAEHLVFRKGLTFTWLSMANPVFCYDLDEVMDY